jgi:hypothetical protein
MNRTYHPKSWSQQARAIANIQFEEVIYYTYICPEKWTPEMAEVKGFNYTTGEIEIHYLSPEQKASRYFQTSYRHPLILQRAAGIFGKKMREYKRKIVENYKNF